MQLSIVLCRSADYGDGDLLAFFRKFMDVLLDKLSFLEYYYTNLALKQSLLKLLLDKAMCLYKE
jgi:hypothetical protein